MQPRHHPVHRAFLPGAAGQCIGQLACFRSTCGMACSSAAAAWPLSSPAGGHSSLSTWSRHSAATSSRCVVVATAASVSHGWPDWQQWAAKAASSCRNKPQTGGQAGSSVDTPPIEARVGSKHSVENAAARGVLLPTWLPLRCHSWPRKGGLLLTMCAWIGAVKPCRQQRHPEMGCHVATNVMRQAWRSPSWLTRTCRRRLPSGAREVPVRGCKW